MTEVAFGANQNIFNVFMPGAREPKDRGGACLSGSCEVKAADVGNKDTKRGKIGSHMNH